MRDDLQVSLPLYIFEERIAGATAITAEMYPNRRGRWGMAMLGKEMLSFPIHNDRR